VLVVNPGFEARTFAEYVAYAKANPGKLAFATSGAGSSNHLLGVRLQQLIGVPMVHVPYRGAGPAMVDTIAGNVPSMFDSLPSAAPHIKGGKVHALAVSGEERNQAVPDVPTMKEQGYPDLISYSWFGISVPAKTPAAIVERLAAEMQTVLKDPAVVKRWEEIGAEASTMTPAEVTRFVQAEIDKWTPVVKASGAKAD
jgi:tripartite-type tricarboxylate transporter receptor subunit TctC